MLMPFAAVTVILSTACGGDSKTAPAAGAAGFSVVITSSDLAVGKQRFAFVALQEDEPMGNEPMYVRFFKIPAKGQAALVGEAAIPWSPLGLEGSKADHPAGAPAHDDAAIDGVYFANIEFDVAGTWGLGVTRGSAVNVAKEARVSFEVRAQTQTLAVGAKAIAVDNPTLKTLPLKQIDTSPEPDDAFHRLSIAEAMRSGKPSIVAFATPSFCVSRTCGPAMQVVAAAAAKYGERVNVVHVEPYELKADGSLFEPKPGERKNVEAADRWRLPTEPWVFVLDAQGTVVARFDGPFAFEELDYYLDALT
jgi:hypothetical protein